MPLREQKIDDLTRLEVMLRQRGRHQLGEWRQARAEFNASPRATQALDARFEGDWYDEVLGVLYYADWTSTPDHEWLELAPPKEPVWDLKLADKLVQVTLAFPDWRVLLAERAPKEDRQYNAGVQRKRRSDKRGRDGLVFSHGLVTPQLGYVEEHEMRSREEGIAACRKGIEDALNSKAEKASRANKVADMLLVYGPELNAFDSMPTTQPFYSMLLGVRPPQALSAYQSVVVVSSAPGWVAEWNASAERWLLSAAS